MIGVLQPVLRVLLFNIILLYCTVPCVAFNHALGSCWCTVNHRQLSPRTSGCSCCRRGFWNSFDKEVVCTILTVVRNVHDGFDCFLTDTLFLSQTRAAIHCRHMHAGTL